MRRTLWLAVVLCAGAWDPIISRNRAVEEGNKQYGSGDFAAAEQQYRKAQERLPGEPGVHFDLGAALHRQAQALPEGPERDKRLDAAAQELRLATDASDVKLRSRAHYNLGNTLFERKKVPDAIEEYKKSLKLDPTSEDARHNLELALRQKPPEPPPQSQPKPQDKQQPKPDEDKQPQPQPQPGEDQKQQPPPDGEKQKDPQDAKGEQQDGKPENRDLSDDDVERKLAELEKRSKDLQVKHAAERSQERRRGKPVKDW